MLRSRRQLFSVLLVFATLTCKPLLALQRPYTNPSAKLPDQPFQVVWHTPVSRCPKEFGVKIDFARYNITINPDLDGWNGSYITIFNPVNLGLYPHIGKDGTIVNGGVPQAVNLKSHLQKAAVDIKKQIPSNTFSGIGVIDWEAWRPTWLRDWDSKAVYRNLSEQLVRKQHPDWNNSHVALEAQRQFEQGARTFLESTLTLAEQMRPNGKWGYYEFPECYNYHYVNKSCSPVTQIENNGLSWLFKSTTALFPSCYLIQEDSSKQKQYFVYGQIQESYRVLEYIMQPHKPIFAYLSYVYFSTSVFYPEDDMKIAIGVPAELGVDGVILWSDNHRSDSHVACQQTKNFVDNILGPLARTAVTFASDCSNNFCNSHGRCYNPDLVDVPNVKPKYSNRAKLNVFNKSFNSVHQQKIHNTDKATRACRCYKGWTGANCDISDL